MSINYIGGATASSVAATVTTLTVSYAPTQGNMVVLGIAFGSGISGLVCVDSNGNVMTFVGQINNTAVFMGVADVGVVSYTFNWVTARKSSCAIAEYQGWSGIGIISNTANLGASTTFSLTTTTGFINSLIIGVIGGSVSNLVYTATTGTIRQQVTGGAGAANNVCIIDNYGTVVGSSVTVAGNISASAQAYELEVELYPGQPITEASSNDDQWLGGEMY